jgi:hypothetical protein
MILLKINGKTILGQDVNPPLHGTDDRIRKARDEEELFKILSIKRTIDICVYDELAPKYNLDFVKGILK